MANLSSFHYPTASDKKVVVTAGGSGIGLAIAKKFLSEGAQVFICDIASQSLELALSKNVGLLGAVADVGDPPSVEALFEKAITSMNGIDVLVNNAGIGGPRATVENINYADWDDCIRVNLSGMFYCAKQVIPAMKAKGSGSIINISTSSAKTGLPNRLPYVASKVGVLGLSHNLARELGEFNIRCNTILPGLMDNPRGRDLVAHYAHANMLSTDEAESKFLKYISLKSWIEPSEIADMVFFLTSEAARHITGQEIAVDGNCEWEQ